jgi:branched-subunit amino acid transport protein
VSETSAYWATIALAGAGTFAIRSSFLLVAHRMTTIPPLLRRCLRMIPAAALSGLVLPALIRPDGVLDIWQPRALVGALAAYVGWRTGNVILTLVIGMGSLIALEQLTGG